MIEVNYVMILVSTVVLFILGAVWYSVLFGKIWMEVMECTHLSKEEIAKMQKEMTPAYVLQFVITFVMVWVLANNLEAVRLNELAGAPSTISPYMMAFWFWFGFMLPVQASAVVWSQTKKKFWTKQIAVSAGFLFVAIMIATFILTM